MQFLCHLSLSLSVELLCEANGSYIYFGESLKRRVCGHPCASFFDEYLLSSDSFKFAIALAAGEEIDGRRG